MSTIKVIIADEQTLFRSAVINGFSLYKEMAVTAEANSDVSLLDIIKNIEQPDVILISSKMLSDNKSVLSQIKKILPNVKIIVMFHDMQPSLIHVAFLMEEGVNSCLENHSTIENIHDAICAVLKEKYHFTDLIEKALIHKLSWAKNDLTDDEMTILQLMCQEKTTKQIADEVGLSHRTIQDKYGNIKIKTGAISLTGLILYAIRNKIAFVR